MSKVVVTEEFTDEEEKPTVKEPEEGQSETDEQNSEKEEVKEEGSEETAEETPEEPDKQSSKIKIGEQEFSEEELQAIITRGTKVKEWETKMPGFNLDTLMPDYTRKSQKLKALEKSVPKAQEKIDLEGIDQEQIQNIEKIARHLGFVRQADLVQDSVETQKNVFIASHPEYSPGLPENDAKWAQLMEQFSLYNWQLHPNKVEEMLEEAHAKVSQTWINTAKGEKTKEAIATKKAQANASTFGGGTSTKQTSAPSNQALAEKYRAAGWSEEDIKDVLS